MTETHRVRDLAQLVSEITGATVDHACPTRATRPTRTTCSSRTDRLLNLGLEPITLAEGLLHEVTEIAQALRRPLRPDQDPLPEPVATARRPALSGPARRRRPGVPPRAEPDRRHRRAERLRPAPGTAAPARAGRVPGLRAVRRPPDRGGRGRLRRPGRGPSGAAAADDLAGCRLPRRLRPRPPARRRPAARAASGRAPCRLAPRRDPRLPRLHLAQPARLSRHRGPPRRHRLRPRAAAGFRSRSGR